MSEQNPVRIVLTPEQREQVRRLSGQAIDAIEVDAEDVKQGGGPLKFFWRLSAATGIPRLAWGDDDGDKSSTSEKKPGS